MGQQARRWPGRWLSGIAARVASGGRAAVHEDWERYPTEPLEPSYYAQLLATASAMSEEEQRARAMCVPHRTARRPHATAT